MRLIRLVKNGAIFACFAATTLAISSCSDPSPAPPQGAFTATFGGSKCPATGGSWSPIVSASGVDGENGAVVSCAVSPSGDGVAVQGSISLGESALSVSNLVLSASAPSSGYLTIRGPNTAGLYVPKPDDACTFTYESSDAGRVSATFTCSTVEATGMIGATCTLTSGRVSFENCGG